MIKTEEVLGKMLSELNNKKNICFYASTNDLDKIPVGTIIDNSVINCIFKKAVELMSIDGIEPTSGVLTEIDSGKKEYTLIERYKEQLTNLNNKVNVYFFLRDNNKIDKKITTSEIKLTSKIEITNLYDFLKKANDFKLIDYNDLDKYFYDIPYDNGDIIQAQFIKIINEDDVLKRNKMIKNLKNLFPNQSVVIKKLLDIMDKMNKEQFLDFIDDIYSRNEFQLNYAKISQGEGNKKKFLSKFRWKNK